jgi:sugar phosphate isomerase/epimerase
MGFQYSVNTNGLRAKHTPREIVALLTKLPVEGIEWGLPKIEAAAGEIQEMASRTRDAGLKTVGYINAGKLWKRDEMVRWSEIVASVGGRSLRVAHPWVAFNFEESLHQGQSYRELFAKCRDALPGLVELGRQYGIRYVLEMHAGSLTASAWAAARLFDGLDPRHVGVIYDPANSVIEGGLRPRSDVEILGPYLAYVHAKNVQWCRRANDLESPVRRAAWAWKGALPAEGQTDWVEIFYALKVNGWSGWVSSEEYFQLGPDAAPLIAEGVAFLKACAAAAPAAPQPPFLSFND